MTRARTIADYGDGIGISETGTGATTATAAASALGVGEEDSPTFSGIKLNKESLTTTVDSEIVTAGATENLETLPFNPAAAGYDFVDSSGPASWTENAGADIRGLPLVSHGGASRLDGGGNYGRNRNNYKQWTNLEANTNYVLSAYVKYYQPGPTYLVDGTQYPDWHIYVGGTAHILTDEWIRVSGFASTTSAGTLNLGFTTTTIPTDALITAVQFEKGTIPTPFVIGKREAGDLVAGGKLIVPGSAVIPYIEGNVGIGITNPYPGQATLLVSKALHVAELAASAELLLGTYSTNIIDNSHITFLKSKGASIGAHLETELGDEIGLMQFNGVGALGNSSIAAKIFVTQSAAAGDSYIPGDINFWTSTTANQFERMIIKSDGNIGIGTNTPSGLFTVLHTGGGVTDGIVVQNTDQSSGSLRAINMHINTTGKGVIEKTSTSSADNDLLLNPTSGNVGIGTITPASLLDVRGTVQVGIDGAGHDVYFYGASSGSNLKWNQTGDQLELTDSTAIKFGGSSELEIYYNGTDSYISNSDGALKIATETSGIAVSIGHTTSETTINDNLIVSGDLIISGNINTQNLLVEDHNIVIGNVTTPTDLTADGGGFTLKGDTDKTILWTNSLDSWVYNQGIVVGSEGAGNDVMFYGDLPSSNMTWNNEIIPGLVLNDSRLYINQDDDDTGIFIDSQATSAGNYCIDIAGKYGLHINQDIAGGFAAKFERNIAGAGSNPLLNLIDDHTSCTQTTLRIQQDGTGDILNLFDGTSEVFTVLDGGNVGIATTSPVSKLEIYTGGNTTIGDIANAGIHIGNNSEASTVNHITFGATSSSVATKGAAYIGYVTTDTTDFCKGDLIFGTREATADTVPTERMCISASGNIGIGTNTPLGLFTVLHTGGGVTDGIVVQNTDQSSGSLRAINMHIDTTGKGVIEKTSEASADNDLLLNPTSGNVGIGTSPSSVLHVSSNPGHTEWSTLIIDNTHDMGSANNGGHSTGSRVMFKGIIDADTQDEPQEIFTIGTDVEAETAGTLAKNNFFIRDEYSSNNPVRLFISSDGNVGIGTTAPFTGTTITPTSGLEISGEQPVLLLSDTSGDKFRFYVHETTGLHIGSDTNNTRSLNVLNDGRVEFAYGIDGGKPDGTNYGFPYQTTSSTMADHKGEPFLNNLTGSYSSYKSIGINATAQNVFKFEFNENIWEAFWAIKFICHAEGSSGAVSSEQEFWIAGGKSTGSFSAVSIEQYNEIIGDTEGSSFASYPANPWGIADVLTSSFMLTFLHNPDPNIYSTNINLSLVPLYMTGSTKFSMIPQ
jgi:hypothetical protein